MYFITFEGFPPNGSTDASRVFGLRMNVYSDKLEPTDFFPLAPDDENNQRFPSVVKINTEGDQKETSAFIGWVSPDQVLGGICHLGSNTTPFFLPLIIHSKPTVEPPPP